MQHKLPSFTKENSSKRVKRLGPIYLGRDKSWLWGKRKLHILGLAVVDAAKTVSLTRNCSFFDYHFMAGFLDISTHVQISRSPIFKRSD